MAFKLYSVQECYGDCSPPSANRPLCPPPPPPPLVEFQVPKKSSIPLIAILLFCALATAFLVVSYLTYIRKYYTNSNNSRRRNRDPPIDEQDFVDLNHGPVLDHPIWYIRTIGLQQSVIDSISVFKYKRDEGLIEGTDCSVCLSEFQEDETLRLLPKCSHAFHIPCIDTWLRSHKNCPLCRAPIVCENARVSAPEPNLSPLGTGEEIQVENSESHDGLGNNQVGGGGNVEMGVENGNLGGLASEEGRIGDISRKNSRGFNSKSCEIRVLSDLADLQTRGEEELQPMRRSISMDSLSASRIHLAVANIPRVLEGSSSTRAVQVKKPNPDKVVKGVRRNLSISRLMKSSSTSFSLQNVPVAMKRSVSSSGKFTSPRRYSKSQDSILPV